jgi:hypothetical protein
MSRTDRTFVERCLPWTAAVLGLAMFANGLVMLGDPWWWYSTVPGVGRTGLFNQHFIRDIGLLYGAIGGAFLVGAMRPDLRLANWLPATLWLTAHAFFHFWEVSAGICGPAYLMTDFPAVSLPALIAMGLTGWAWHRRVVAAAGGFHGLSGDRPA